MLRRLFSQHFEIKNYFKGIAKGVLQWYTFLNQAHAWFLKIDMMRTSVCVSVCVCLCVSAPQAIKNYLREMKSE